MFWWHFSAGFALDWSQRFTFEVRHLGLHVKVCGLWSFLFDNSCKMGVKRRDEDGCTRCGMGWDSL
jgi:hypothetical protein